MYYQNFNKTSNDVVNYEQLGPVCYQVYAKYSDNLTNFIFFLFLIKHKLLGLSESTHTLCFTAK